MKIPINSKYYIYLIVIFSAIILFVDFITGRDIRVSTLFVFPVALSAWTNHKYLAYILAVLLPCIRLLFFIPWGQIENIFIGYVNAFIRIVMLLLVAFLADQARNVGKLKKQLKILEGILPICSSCKKIQDKEGNWHQIESYTSDRSDTEFSHGICPECINKLYPEFIEKK